MQALVKLGLEPEWEARFEPNSYGFRPGRSCHDAIEAIFKSISLKAKYVLDADISKCFDRINHDILLKKLNTYPTLRKQIRAWLKAGVMDGKELFPTIEGTPQGGVMLVRQMLLKSDSSEELAVVNDQLLEKQNLVSSVSPTEVANHTNKHVIAIALTTDTKGLKEVLAEFKGIESAIIVTQQGSSQDDELVVTLSSGTSFNVKLAESGDILRPGTVYIAPRGYHVLVNPDGSLALLPSKLVHFAKPSADLLFESVAGSFREKAIALILNPTGKDGIMGLRAIRETGGYAIAVQGSETIMQEYVDNAQVLPLSEVAQTLINLIKIE